MKSTPNHINIRKALATDMPAIHNLIKELAIYEKAEDEVATTPEELVKDGFGENPAFEAIVAENQESTIVGFALFFTAYSTWKGKSLYLEDFIVTEKQRKTGIGKLLFDRLFEIAKERKVKRFHWQVLDWNKTAIDFYKKYPTEFEDDWLNVKIRFD